MYQEYYNQLEIALDSWHQEPEELGALLHDATMRIPYVGEYSDKFRQERRSAKQNARKMILDNLPNGERLIELQVHVNTFYQ